MNAGGDPLHDPIYVWTEADPGFAETGWLFLAAGIGLDEAAAHLKDGANTSALLTMAALRGSHLPLTP